MTVFDPSAARSGAIFSDNPNYTAAWICYINGIEVPILGYSVNVGATGADTEGIWQIPEFQIHLAPDILVQRLGYEDRMMVALFYLDQWSEGEREFRLLIDGEIAGWSFQMVSGQRVLSYTCMASIQIFQAIYFFFMNTLDDVVAAQDPAIQMTGLTQAGVFYPYSLFHTGLVTPPQVGRVEDANGQPVRSLGMQGAIRNAALRRGTADVSGEDDPNQTADDPIKAPFELVYNVIRGLISVAPTVANPEEGGVSDTNRSLPAMNFFARHLRKTRLYNRFVRLPILEDIQNLNDRHGVFPIFNAARNDQALSAMQRQVAGQIANSGSVWEILKQVLSIVYMEIAMIPAAPCVQTNLEGEILGPVDAQIPLVAQTPPVPTPAQVAAPTPTPAAPLRALDIYQHVLDTLTLAIRETNPDFNPNDAFGQAMGDIRNGSVEGTPAEFAERLGSQMQRQYAPAASALSRTIAAFRAQYANRTATDIAQQEQTQRQQVEAAQQAAALVATAQNIAATTREAALTAPRAIMGLPPDQPARLAQYFVKPQLLFSMAPMCNVVFPSMIDDFQFSESYWDQPTRLYVNDSVMSAAMRATGAQREFMLHALTVGYPDEADAILHTSTGQQSEGATHNTGKDLLIWPEEYYRGPVVSRMSLPRWFQYLQQMRNASASGDSGNTGGGFIANALATPALPTGPANSQPTGTTGAITGLTTVTAGSPPTSAPVGTAANAQIPATVRVSLPGGYGNMPSSLPHYSLTPMAWARDKHSAGVTRWTQYSEFFTRAVDAAFPGANPMFLLGISLNGGQYENTTGFQLGSREERYDPPNESFSRLVPLTRTDVQRQAFHELGMFGVEGGHRLGPAPNTEGGHSSWIPLATSPLVRRILGGRAARIDPGGWRDARDQIAVGVARIRQIADNVKRILGTLGGHSTTSAWFIMMGAMGWSVGDVGAAAHIRAFAQEYPEFAQAPENAKWTRLQQNIYDGITRQHKVYRGRRHANPVFSVLRTLQKMEGGFLCAQLLGHSTSGFEVGLGVQKQLIQYVIAQAAFGRIVAVEQARGGLATGTNNPIELTINIPPPPPTPRVYARTRVTAVPAERVVTRISSTTTTIPPGTTTTATGAPDAPPAVGTSATTAAPPEIEPNSDASFQQLFKLYTQYEYLRQRYTKRNSSLRLQFNPHIVTGFPCVIFDSMRTRQHVVGYVVGYTHSAFVGGGASGTVGTAVSLSCVRTLPEFFQDVRNDAERFSQRVLAAPAEIINEIRNATQMEATNENPQGAEQFYMRLFYANRPRVMSRRAAFDFTLALGYANGLEADPITITQTDTVQTDVNRPAPTVSPTPPSSTPGQPLTTQALADAFSRVIYNPGQTRDLTYTGAYQVANFVRGEILRRHAASIDQALQAALAMLQLQTSGDGQLGSGVAQSLMAACRQEALRLAQPPSTQADPPVPLNQTVTTTREVRHNLDPNRDVVPMPGSEYQTAFDQYDMAMRLTWRPICTLAQYIRFLHGGRTVGDLIASGDVEDGDDFFSYEYVIENDVNVEGTGPVGQQEVARGPTERRTATVYKRIYKLRQGPGPKPTPNQRGYIQAEAITPSVEREGLPADYPQTRADWETQLLAYREKVRRRISPGV